jgi:hypothetical protein
VRLGRHGVPGLHEAARHLRRERLHVLARGPTASVRRRLRAGVPVTLRSRGSAANPA